MSSNDNLVQEDKMLESIKKLQKMESDLYGFLQSRSSAGADLQEQEEIVEKINSLSEIRISMFKEITNNYGNLQKRLSSKRDDVVDKLTVVGLVEQELDNAKKNLNSLKTDRNNKLRMVEINTYYAKQYSAHTEVMLIVLYTFLPIFVLALVKRQDIIPANILNAIIGLVALVGASAFSIKVFDLSRRNNMDYDKYDWPSMTSKDLLDEHNQGTQEDNSVEGDYKIPSLGGCIGKYCCAEGTQYDETMNQCVVNLK